jgi:hypothetical protein
MADRHIARQRFDRLTVKDIEHKPEILAARDHSIIIDGNTAGLLPPVLKREKRVECI